MSTAFVAWLRRPDIRLGAALLLTAGMWFLATIAVAVYLTSGRLASTVATLMRATSSVEWR